MSALAPESGHLSLQVRYGPIADTGLCALRTKTHSRSRKCLIRGILNAGEHKRANDCDGDCCNACKNEDSHDPPLSLLRLATHMSAKGQFWAYLAHSPSSASNIDIISAPSLSFSGSMS
jgi:hypothetical protein